MGMWKVASVSRFVPEELVLRFVVCGYVMRIFHDMRSTNAEVRKDGEVIGKLNSTAVRKDELDSHRSRMLALPYGHSSRMLGRRGGGGRSSGTFSTGGGSVNTAGN